MTCWRRASTASSVPGLVNLAEVADRGMRPVNWGGLAKGSPCGLPESFDGVRKKAFCTETRGDRHLVLMVKQLFKCSNGVGVQSLPRCLLVRKTGDL